MLLIAFAAQAQTKSKNFSLSPMTRDTEKVNGLVVGIGHFQQANIVQTINGINVDVMPLSPMIALLAVMYEAPFRYDPHSPEKLKLISNGLNIGIGGYLEGVEHNGISIALYNAGYASNGLGIHAVFSRTKNLNGLHISAFGNASETSNGLNISFYNGSQTMNGVQIGILNSSTRLKGLQIGLLNRTKALKGLQIGLINVNDKRTLPLINF
jgi:hypothetical protein